MTMSPGKMGECFPILVVTLCFVQGASNFVMEALVPLPPGVEKDYVNYMEPDMLHGTKQWFAPWPRNSAHRSPSN